MRGMVAPVPMGATGMRKAPANSTISSTVWRRVHDWTASSTSCRRGQRPNCWASPGSSARSGRSIITVKSCHCCALSMATPAHPSSAGSIDGTSTERWKTWRMKWSRSPVSEACSGSNGFREIERHSSAETSTWSPRPVARARRHAARPPMAAHVPVIQSPNCPPAATGGRSGVPRPPMEPDTACKVNSLAGLCAQGPVWPNGVMETTVSVGLDARSSRRPRPSAASVPGSADSTRRSAEAARSRIAARPACVVTSATMLPFPACRNDESGEWSPDGTGLPTTRRRRRGSPPGGSTFSISAPASTQSLVQ